MNTTFKNITVKINGVEIEGFTGIDEIKVKPKPKKQLLTLLKNSFKFPGTHRVMGFPYFYKSRFFSYIGFGLNKLFDIKAHKNGFIFIIPYFNTIQKKVEICVEFSPFNITKYRY